MKNCRLFFAALLCGLMFSGSIFAADYGLSIAGTKVTDANKTNIRAGVSFDSETNTLTLNNANFSANLDNVLGIDNRIDGLTIQLIGHNRIETTNAQGIYSAGDLTITGDGSITVEVFATESGKCAIYERNGLLTIKNTTVTAIIGYGLGAHGLNASLCIDNSTFKVIGSVASIDNFTQITHPGSILTAPTGAYIADGTVKKEGVQVTEEVVFNPIKLYDLKVAGVQVTEANSDDVLNDGKVSYNSASNTLTLDSADIVCDTIGIYNGIENLTIELIGTNKLNSSTYSGIYSSKNFTINGGGSLDAQLTNPFSPCIYVYHCNLTIEDVTISVESGGWGIAGQDKSTEILTIRNATVKVTSKKGSVCDFKEIILEGGCDIISPRNAVLDGGSVVVDGKNATEEVVIKPVEPYDLKVAGVQVTDKNCYDVLSDGGSVQYDDSKKTLYLENIDIETTELHDVAVDSHIEGLEVVLRGENKITNKGWAFYFSNSATISGAGSLVANCICGLSFNGGDLTIDNTTLTLSGEYGFVGGSKVETLTIIGSDVKVTGSMFGAVRSVKDMKLVNCGIKSHENTQIYNGQLVLMSALTEPITDEVVIGVQKYGLSVANVEVTEGNCENIVAEGIKAGKASFDPETNTLTLENATIDVPNACIQNNSIDLKVVLVGENTMKASGSCIWAYKNLEISFGKLTTNSTGSSINAHGQKVKIAGCTLNTTSMAQSIVADTVEVYNSTLNLSSTSAALSVSKTVIANNSALNLGTNIGISMSDENALVRLTNCQTNIDVKYPGIQGNGDNSVIEISGGTLQITNQSAPCLGAKTVKLTNVETDLNGYMAISAVDDVTIEGGTFLHQSTSSTTPSISAANLTIKNADVDLGSSISSPKIVVDNSQLNVESSNAPCITFADMLSIENSQVELAHIMNQMCLYSDEGKVFVEASDMRLTNVPEDPEIPVLKVGDLQLTDCEITSHAGADFDAETATVLFEGNPISGELVITKTTTALETVVSDAKIFAINGRIFRAENARIYDILGRDVTRMNGNLKGVFVVKSDSFVEKIVVR